MDIEYDPNKRRITLQERGSDMAGAIEVFEGANLTFTDIRFEYGEERLVTVGYLESNMVVLAWTFRGRTRRIISLRKADARERKTYGGRL